MIKGLRLVGADGQSHKVEEIIVQGGQFTDSAVFANDEEETEPDLGSVLS